jgi:tRNA(Ile)-lysidine synthetase-like protein
MNIEARPGKYIIAVSGGVDSMVLLRLMYERLDSKEQSQSPQTSLVVAHFNHGIRKDASEDEKLVCEVSQQYNLPFEAGYGNLGKNTSEQLARTRRYEFLESVKAKHSADYIMTAHHQDDLIETAFINVLRGSGHRGLVAMKINTHITRPLIHISKQEILAYAKKHKIKWREDITNQDDVYLRNYIRNNILAGLTDEKRNLLVHNIEKIADIIAEKDISVAKMSQNISSENAILRGKYIVLPLEVRRELIMYWLRTEGHRNFEKQSIEKLDIALKTGKAGTKYPVKKDLWLKLSQKSARFVSQD